MPREIKKGVKITLKGEELWFVGREVFCNCGYVGELTKKDIRNVTVRREKVTVAVIPCRYCGGDAVSLHK